MHSRVWGRALCVRTSFACVQLKMVKPRARNRLLGNHRLADCRALTRTLQIVTQKKMAGTSIMAHSPFPICLLLSFFLSPKSHACMKCLYYLQVPAYRSRQCARLTLRHPTCTS